MWSLKSGEELLWMMLMMLVGIGSIIILAITVYLAMVLKQAIDPAKPQPHAPKPTFWQRFTGLKPISEEKNLVMEHAYDGIVELDNPTPPWFMYLFYGTIGFGIVYLFLFHLTGVGKLQTDEYTQEVAVAEEKRAAYIKLVAGKINENTATRLTDAKALGEGQTLYTQYCVACHGAAGQGGVGPNLTDEYWLHGGSVKAIFRTITEGVPEKGMLSWKKQLNPLQVQQVTSFILSLQGTNPPGAKPPQGDKAAAGADKVALR